MGIIFIFWWKQKYFILFFKNVDLTVMLSARILLFFPLKRNWMFGYWGRFNWGTWLRLREGAAVSTYRMGVRSIKDWFFASLCVPLHPPGLFHLLLSLSVCQAVPLVSISLVLPTPSPSHLSHLQRQDCYWTLSMDKYWCARRLLHDTGHTLVSVQRPRTDNQAWVSCL